MHLVDRLVERRCARRQSDRVDVIKPRGIQIIGTLDLEGWSLVFVTQMNQSPGVVRIPAAHDDDGVHAAHQVEQCALAKLGGLADRVDDANISQGVRRRIHEQTSVTTSGGMVVWQTTPNRRLS